MSYMEYKDLKEINIVSVPAPTNNGNPIGTRLPAFEFWGFILKI